MKAIAQIQATPKPEIPYPSYDYSIWGTVERIGIPGAILVMVVLVIRNFALKALDTYWKNLAEDRAEAQKKRNQEYEERKTNMEAMHRQYDAAMARTFNSHETLLEDLGATQRAIAQTQVIQQQQFEAISQGFEASIANQERQVELLTKIADALERSTPHS